MSVPGPSQRARSSAGQVWQPGMSPPAAVEVATWLWIASAAVLALGLTAATVLGEGGSGWIWLVPALGMVTFFVFGCWQFRAGVDGWRIGFTVLAIIHGPMLVFFVPLEAQKNPVEPWVAAPVMLTGGLVIAGLVAAWMTSSRWYFFDVGQYKKTQRMQAQAMPGQPPYAQPFPLQQGYAPQGPQGRPPYGPPQGPHQGQQPPQPPPYYGNPPQQ